MRPGSIKIYNLKKDQAASNNETLIVLAFPNFPMVSIIGVNDKSSIYHPVKVSLTLLRVQLPYPLQWSIHMFLPYFKVRQKCMYDAADAHGFNWMSMRNSPSLFDSIRTKKCIVIVILLFKYLSPFHSTLPISSWTTRARDGKRTRASISLMPNKHTSSNNAISNRFPRI